MKGFIAIVDDKYDMQLNVAAIAYISASGINKTRITFINALVIDGNDEKSIVVDKDINQIINLVKQAT